MAFSAYTLSTCWLQVLATDEGIEVVHCQVLKCTQRVLYPNPDHYSLRNLERTNQPGFSRERISCTLSLEIPKLSFSGTTTQYITRHHLSVCPDCIVYISGCIEVKLSDVAYYMQRVRIKVLDQTVQVKSDIVRRLSNDGHKGFCPWKGNISDPCTPLPTNHLHPSHYLNKKRKEIRTLSEIESVCKWLNELTEIHRGCFSDTTVVCSMYIQ